MPTSFVAMACLLGLAGCGGGATYGDASPPAFDALDDAPGDVASDSVVDAPQDAPIDAPQDAQVDAPQDAQVGIASYVVVESMLEVRADIGRPGTAMVHVMNTGTTVLGFELRVTGENKGAGNQMFSSGGCSVVAPGDECIGYVRFFPTWSGDRSTSLTIHPYAAGLSDTIVPVLARTYTRVSVGDFSGATAGTVTTNSPDVVCTNADCTGHFLGDLTLTASPASGYVFVGWTDATCGSSPTCFVPRSTSSRQIAASFAPAQPGQLTLNMTGAPPGALVSVQDLASFTPERMLAVCSVTCTVPLPSQFSPTPQILVTVFSPRGHSSITGACTGTDQCSFPAAASAALTVQWTFDPKLVWASVFDMGPLRSVARGPNGELFVSTIVYGSDAQWTMKLDATGRVVWAYPTSGVLQALANGGVAVSFPTSGILARQRIELLDANGYPTGGYGNNEIYATQTPNVEVNHFARVLAMGTSMFATPGTKTGLSAIESWSPSAHWSATVPGTGVRSLAADAAGVFYLATRTASGNISATKFSATGANLGEIADVAQGAPLVMAVSSGGDVVTTSGTTQEVILRRVSPNGQLMFQRDFAMTSLGPARAGVVILPDDDALWIHGTRGQSGGSDTPKGFVAERVAPTGSVIWSLTQPTPPGGFTGIEVYDLTSGGGDAIAAGAFTNHGLGTLGAFESVVGQSWVGMFAP